MTLPPNGDPRATFEYFSSEYAQALQAYETIEAQASTLAFMGHYDELRQFLDQFIEMAERTRAQAASADEHNFEEWFGELVAKARQLRVSVPG